MELAGVEVDPRGSGMAAVFVPNDRGTVLQDREKGKGREGGGGWAAWLEAVNGTRVQGPASRLFEKQTREKKDGCYRAIGLGPRRLSLFVLSSRVG